MVRMSVDEAARRLGVSPARVRQRIQDGSVPAEKVGGRWLVHLAAAQAASPRRGRPVLPASVWSALARLSADPVVGTDVEGQNTVDHVRALVSPAARSRASAQLRNGLSAADRSVLLSWLSARAQRRLYVMPAADLEALRQDDRLSLSGLSHPSSHMSSPSVVEGYVAESDLEALVDQYWLDQPAPGEDANVVLHVAPLRPQRVSRLLLAADLAEHGGPRERQRARELVDQVADETAPRRLS